MSKLCSNLSFDIFTLTNISFGSLLQLFEQISLDKFWCRPNINDLIDVQGSRGGQIYCCPVQSLGNHGHLKRLTKAKNTT